jgi:hypothetical protein
MHVEAMEGDYSIIHNYAENVKKIWPVHTLDVGRQLSA